MPLYKVTFTDDSTFLGGDTLENSKWDIIPDKEILCLEYFLYNGSSIILKNYESYAVFTEAANTFLKNSGTCAKCKKLGKIISADMKHGDGGTKKRFLVKCLDKECDYVTRLHLSKDAEVGNRFKYKYIMGLKEGKVSSYRIALNGVEGKDKYHTGDITTREYPKGKEFRGREAVSDIAWKKGIK